MIDWGKITLEELAAFLSENLRKQGIDAILVGGACVTIHSRNRYQSYDLDFATYEDMKIVKQAMAKLGFNWKSGYFVHPECKWFVEFVSPPIAVGDQPIFNFETKQCALGSIRMLRCEDSVKDRLASYFHWNDRQGLEQALQICLECWVDLEEIKTWAIYENHLLKFEDFYRRLSDLKS